jgi:hypothetical protein
MSANPNSILDSVKKTLGFDPEFTAFDLDITLNINSAFGTLQQIGVGPGKGFAITDNTTLWSQYVNSLLYLGMVKQYIFLSVKMAFDPPATSFAIEAIQKQLAALEWRLNVWAESRQANPSNWWDLTGLPDFPDEASVGDYGYDTESDDIYVNVAQTADGYWWNLTGLSDFPGEALVGEFGYNTSTGDVWRKTG